MYIFRSSFRFTSRKFGGSKPTTFHLGQLMQLCSPLYQLFLLRGQMQIAPLILLRPLIPLEVPLIPSFEELVKKLLP